MAVAPLFLLLMLLLSLVVSFHATSSAASSAASAAPTRGVVLVVPAVRAVESDLEKCEFWNESIHGHLQTQAKLAHHSRTARSMVAHHELFLLQLQHEHDDQTISHLPPPPQLFFCHPWLCRNLTSSSVTCVSNSPPPLSGVDVDFLRSDKSDLNSFSSSVLLSLQRWEQFRSSMCLPQLQSILSATATATATAFIMLVDTLTIVRYDRLSTLSFPSSSSAASPIKKPWCFTSTSLVSTLSLPSTPPVNSSSPTATQSAMYLYPRRQSEIEVMENGVSAGTFDLISSLADDMANPSSTWAWTSSARSYSAAALAWHQREGCPATAASYGFIDDNSHHDDTNNNRNNICTRYQQMLRTFTRNNSSNEAFMTLANTRLTPTKIFGGTSIVLNDGVENNSNNQNHLSMDDLSCLADPRLVQFPRRHSTFCNLGSDLLCVEYYLTATPVDLEKALPILRQCFEPHHTNAFATAKPNEHTNFAGWIPSSSTSLLSSNATRDILQLESSGLETSSAGGGVNILLSTHSTEVAEVISFMHQLTSRGKASLALLLADTLAFSWLQRQASSPAQLLELLSWKDGVSTVRTNFPSDADNNAHGWELRASFSLLAQYTTAACFARHFELCAVASTQLLLHPAWQEARAAVLSSSSSSSINIPNGAGTQDTHDVTAGLGSSLRQLKYQVYRPQQVRPRANTFMTFRKSAEMLCFSRNSKVKCDTSAIGGGGKPDDLWISVSFSSLQQLRRLSLRAAMVPSQFLDPEMWNAQLLAIITAHSALPNSPVPFQQQYSQLPRVITLCRKLGSGDLCGDSSWKSWTSEDAPEDSSAPTPSPTPTPTPTPSPTPSPTPIKSGMVPLAFVLQLCCHYGMESGLRLLRRLYHPANTYVLHLDSKRPVEEHLALRRAVEADEEYARHGNVHILQPHYVQYQGVTVTYNEVAALRLAVVADVARVNADGESKPGHPRRQRWQYAFALSGSHYPLIPVSAMMELFYNLPPGLSLMDFWDERAGFWEDLHHYYYDSLWHDVAIEGSPAPDQSITDQAMSASKRRPVHREFGLKKGHAWVTVSRDLADYIVGASQPQHHQGTPPVLPLPDLLQDSFPERVLLYLTNALSADEFYFHTVATASPFAHTVIRFVSTHLRWRIRDRNTNELLNQLCSQTLSPCSLELEDYDEVANSGFMFARKIFDTRLMDAVDKHLLGIANVRSETTVVETLEGEVGIGVGTVAGPDFDFRAGAALRLRLWNRLSRWTYDDILLGSWAYQVRLKRFRRWMEAIQLWEQQHIGSQ